MATRWARRKRPPSKRPLASLKDAVKGEDAEAIKEKTNTLAQASMKLGEAMYKAQQAEGAAADAAADGGNKPDDNVVDADFEEVDDNKKGGLKLSTGLRVKRAGPFVSSGGRI